MSDLVEFLLARIAEDEEAAREAPNGSGRWFTEEELVSVWPGDHSVLEFPTKGDARHAAHWSPARVLAECEAKRRIVGWYASLSERVEAVPALEPRQNELGMVLRALALPYADHPSYDEAWRP